MGRSGLLILLLVALPLAGCGKKAPPEAPDRDQDVYPMSYPSNNADPRLPNATSPAPTTRLGGQRKKGDQTDDADPNQPDLPPAQPNQ